MTTMRAIDILDLGLDLDGLVFPLDDLAATETAWEIVKRKAKNAQAKGFMSWERQPKDASRGVKKGLAGLYGLAFDVNCHDA